MLRDAQVIDLENLGSSLFIPFILGDAKNKVGISILPDKYGKVARINGKNEYAIKEEIINILIQGLAKYIDLKTQIKFYGILSGRDYNPKRIYRVLCYIF